MKHSWVLLALLLVSLSVAAQSIDLNTGGFKDDVYFIELPYEMLRDKIIITAEVSGSPLRFLLDTGAPTSISANRYAALGLSQIGKVLVTDINNTSDTLLVARLDSFSLGGFSLVGVPAMVIKAGIATECLSIDGILGSNTLRNSVIQLDAQNKVIRITNDIQKVDTRDSREREIILDRQSMPVFTIQIGKNIAEMLLFDSGSDEFYAMANHHKEEFKKAKSFTILAESNGVNTIGLHGIGKGATTARIAIPEMVINGVPFQDVVAETTMDNNSRVGVKLLDYGVLTLDYKNKRSYFKPHTIPAGFRETFWPVNPALVDGQWVIGKIWSKEIAKKIDVGDPLIAIDDSPMVNMSVCELLMSSPLDGKTKAQMVVKNKRGELQTIEIVKR